jgi:alpha-tubulin suppressor-like RCC1 family protein
VPGVTNAEAVQGGENHVLWLVEGGIVKSCGTNAQGQLGLGSGVKSEGRATTVEFPTGTPKIVEISAGQRTSAAVDAAGRLFMWGGNETGAVGVGKEQKDVYTPTLVALPPEAGQVEQVSAGGDVGENDHTLAIAGGEAYGWGEDADGEVNEIQAAKKEGRKTLHGVYTPVAIGHHYSRVVASGEYSLGLEGGNLYAWGSGARDGLGTGSTKTEPKRQQVTINGTPSRDLRDSVRLARVHRRRARRGPLSRNRTQLRTLIRSS